MTDSEIRKEKKEKKQKKEKKERKEKKEKRDVAHMNGDTQSDAGDGQRLGNASVSSPTKKQRTDRQDTPSESFSFGFSSFGSENTNDQESSSGFSFNFGESSGYSQSTSTGSSGTNLRSLFHVYTDSDLTSFAFSQGQAPKGVGGVVKAMADNMTRELTKHNVSALDLLQSEEDALRVVQNAPKEEVASFSFGFDVATGPSDPAKSFSFGFGLDTPADEAAPATASTGEKPSLASMFSKPSERTQHVDMDLQPPLKEQPVARVVDVSKVARSYEEKAELAREKLVNCMDEGLVPTFAHIFKRTSSIPQLREMHYARMRLIKNTFSSHIRSARAMQTRMTTEKRNKH